MARSDNWRLNKSGIMAVEGAQITRALQKVAGAAGLPGSFKVGFRPKGRDGGAINFANREVFIGAGSLFTEAPLGGDKFDALVGLTLHEVGHWNIGTDEIERLYRGYATKIMMPDREKHLFQKFLNIGEDTAVEKYICDQNLMEYYQATYRWAMNGERHVDLNKLLEVWIEIALGYKADLMLRVPRQLEEPLRQLMALTQWLRSATRSADERMEAYTSYWKAIRDTVLNPPKPPEPPKPEKKDGDKSESDDIDTVDGDKTGNVHGSDKQPEKNGEKDTEDKDTPQQSKDGESGLPTGDGKDNKKELESPYDAREEDGMDESLLEDIEDAIESNSEDITELVEKEMEAKQLIGYDGKSEPVIRSRECASPVIVPEFHLTKRLERILSIKKRLQMRTMRGEKYGKVDARRLHRTATDQRVFNQRYKFPDGFPKTIILLDLSRSMASKQVRETLEASASLQALVKAEVWGYGWNGNQTKLKRIDDGRSVHIADARGRTPSGTAIVGVSLGLKRGDLVIHLTDGDANCGAISPLEAFMKLSKRGIRLVNIIWGTDYDYASEYRGMEVRKINGLAEFPDALYGILVEESKLGNLI